ncbi:hypothetical protein BM221_002429 [Beauveria bassiana]|uniref:Uncharacterized protein n=1 Tax=Beauveria bassiana TaxID=176275 RepID=A0A2N6NYH8_BEABA|nr:hypothetical protein BM221_002429 [Beauveria bassiana]
MDDTQLISPAMIDKITKLVDEGSRGILTENPSLEEGISAVQDSPSIEVAPGTEFNVIAGPDIV